MSESLSSSSRWSVYALLICVGAGLVAARIMGVESPDPRSPTPFQSANDKSRWATIRALADDGTYAIDQIIFGPQSAPLPFEAMGPQVRGWYTIDLVRHRGSDGKEHYYSSKPTLLPTLLAGVYWLVRSLTGATLASDPHYVARIMLVLVNLLPLVGAQVLLTRQIDRLAQTDWSRLFGVTALVFGTFVTTFSVTLNNHTVAALSVIGGLAAALPVWANESRALWRLGVAGLAFGFAAANELPALSLCVLIGAALAWKAPLETLAGYVPAVLLVATAALGTNYIAHGDWRTPYAHRKDGPVVAQFPGTLQSLRQRGPNPPLEHAIKDAGGELSHTYFIEIPRRTPKSRRVLWDQANQQRFALVQAEGHVEVRRWDDWYDYPGTHWDPATLDGLDAGERSPVVYAFHCLIGHHGLFSLTPIWLLSAAGCVIWLRGRDPARRGLAGMTILITIVVLGFYLTRPLIDRNYGGGTSCLRWLLWLTPLWLLTLLPAADWLGTSRWGRALALALLAVSVFSAYYAADNPWADPWIYDYWTRLGWIKY
ncbi:MAG: hypothetical protein SFU86_16230 [Pirellulaceae bacterium]|nr:hypothetical protein [Pirellulaceae bacterium]